MKRTLGCIVALLALAVSVSSASEDYIPAGPLHDAGLAKYWQLQVPLDEAQSVSGLFLVDDALYVATQDGYVYAIDAPTGVIRWLQPVSRSGYPVRRPCHAGSWVFFVTPIDVQAYDRLTGDPVDRRALRFPASTAPVSDGTRLYIGGIDHRLYALSSYTLFVEWRGLTDGSVLSTPVLYNGRLFIGNDGGTVYACRAADRAYTWRAATYGPVSADLVVDERGVYVASRDQTLYLLDLEYGQVRWQVQLSSPLYDPPFVTADTVYQYSGTDGLAAVEPGLAYEIDKRIRWKLPEGRLVLAVAPPTAFVRARDGDILAVRTEDGTVRHTIPAASLPLSVSVAGAPTILVAGTDGRVFCARPVGTPALRRDQVLSALRVPTTEAETVVVEAPTTQPAAAAVIDLLGSKRSGPPIGGKSKVSREFQGGEPE